MIVGAWSMVVMLWQLLLLLLLVFFLQGFAAEAAGYFESTLQFQPNFEPAAERLKAVRCISLLKHIQV